MTRVVGVRFKTAGKVYYFDPGPFDVTVGMKVVVETARGVEIGEVIVRPKEVPEEDCRAAAQESAADRDPRRPGAPKRKRLQARKSAFEMCQERIASHELPMKLDRRRVHLRQEQSDLLLYGGKAGRLSQAGEGSGPALSFPDRAAADRRARRGQDAGRLRHLRPPLVLRHVDHRF